MDFDYILNPPRITFVHQCNSSVHSPLKRCNEWLFVHVPNQLNIFYIYVLQTWLTNEIRIREGGMYLHIYIIAYRCYKLVHLQLYSLK